MSQKTLFLLAFFSIVINNKILPQFNPKTYALHKVNIIDVKNNKVLKNKTITIDAGTIVDIVDSDKYVENDTIHKLNYRRYYVLPGLIDAHIHLGTNPSSDDNLEVTKERLKYLLKNGVTSVRDMAGDARFLNYISRQASLDEIVSPNIYFSALLAGATFFDDPRTKAAAQGFPAGAAPWMRAVTPDSDLDQIIAEAKGTGATGIKIYADLDQDMVAKIVQAAHARNMKVWAHACVFPASPVQVCEAGVDVMSHATYLAWEGQAEIPHSAKERHRKHESFITNDPKFEDLVNRMKANHTILDATLALYKRYFPDSTLFNYGVTLTKLAYEHGVKIGVGTDLAINDLQGPSTIVQEMMVLHHYVGMKPLDIIRGATLINARMMGEEHKIGTVEVGKIADLLIVKEDPIKDLINLKDPEIVVKNGRLYDFHSN